MKKILALLLALILCISSFVFTSCFAKHPIEVMRDKIDKENSCQLTMTMVILGETVSITCFVDENIEYYPKSLVNDEYYIETIGDVKFKYTKTEYGTWVKTQYIEDPNNTSGITEESVKELFNSDNYDEFKDRKNMYKQKADVAFYNFSNVIMTVGESSCTINALMLINGTNVNVTIVYSNIGTINLTLPAVA